MKKQMILLSMVVVSSVARLDAMNVTASTSDAAVLPSSMKAMVKLPTAKVLAQRLLALDGLDYFIQKSKLHEELADKNLHPTGVDMSVKLAIEDYLETDGSTVRTALLHTKQPLMIRAILADHPQAIKLLEDNGFFEAQGQAAPEAKVAETKKKTASEQAAAEADDAWDNEVTWH